MVYKNFQKVLWISIQKKFMRILKKYVIKIFFEFSKIILWIFQKFWKNLWRFKKQL